VKAVANVLASRGIRVRGFVTEEVLGPGGGRIGFDVVTIPDSKRGVLSRKFERGKGLGFPKTGKYSVDVSAFEALALPTLDDDDEPRTVYVLDEIGRMELHSSKFTARVEALLRRGVLMIGAITAPIYGHRVPFCDRVGATRGVAVHKLTAKTRDAVTEALTAEVCDRWVETKRKRP
jgi:nucleoside-triphosphatase